MDNIIELFSNFLESENKSGTTIEQYIKHVKEFLAFVKDDSVRTVKDIEIAHLDQYQYQLMKKNKSPSVAKKMSALRTFFKYLQKRKHIETNPMLEMSSVKIKDVDRKKKESLALDEALKLIDRTEKNSIPSLKLRNKVLVMAFLFFGMRVSELCNLKTASIEFKEKTVYIAGKGGKIREVPLFDEITPAIKEYIRNKKNKSEFLFNVKKTDKPLEPRSTLDLIKRHARMAKIKKNIGCHSLRRTAATLLLEAGVDLKKIQTFLGHKLITTTMLYLDTDIEKTKQEIRSKNLLAKGIKKVK